MGGDDVLSFEAKRVPLGATGQQVGPRSLAPILREHAHTLALRRVSAVLREGGR